MNNQDKADEIAKDLENCDFDNESAWQGAMDMAEWKDEQHDDKINKVHEDVYDWIESNCRTDISVADCTNMVRWIFKELKDK